MLRRTLAVITLLAVALLLAQPALASVEDIFNTLPVPGKQGQIRLMTENHQAWYARWRIIEGAKKSIDCTYFSANNDIIGRAMLGLLMRKAAEGIAIRLMVDQRGAMPLFNPIFHQDYLPALASFPNVKIRVYNGYKSPLRRVPQAILAGIASNHSKIIVVDGELLVAGGRNLQTHWFTSPADDAKSISDADVLIQGGDVAAQALSVFEREYDSMRNLHVEPLPPEELPEVAVKLERARAAMFARMTDRPLPALAPGGPIEENAVTIEKELEAFRSMRGYGNFELFVDAEKPPIAVLGKGSAATPGHNDITESLLRLIGAAKEEIVIGSAYLVLTDRAKAALQAAGKRGVKIRILTNSPESTGSLFTQAWFVKEWKSYLKDIPGLRLFAIAEKRKLHAKVFSFDGKVAIVGSYNMDPMSEDINGEDIAVIRSTHTCSSIVAWLDELTKLALENKIRLTPGGTPVQVVGPSDHCSKLVLALLKLIGSFSFLRPIV